MDDKVTTSSPRACINRVHPRVNRPQPHHHHSRPSSSRSSLSSFSGESISTVKNASKDGFFVFRCSSLVSLHGGVKDVSPLLSSSSNLRVSPGKSENFSVSVRATKDSTADALSGVVFQPFEEVKKELDLVPTSAHVSLARQSTQTSANPRLTSRSSNVEYNLSYVYHAMYAYFDRDNVALKGLAKFKESSVEEREHAEKLMEYQNKRGGKVKLQFIVASLEFEHVASENGDVHLADFIESEFLTEQVEAIKKISEYVAQLRRVGKGHGTWHFNQMLLEQ
ncbi:hypothetical protein Bca52824_092978 [Brassica carinata]|uniref:Ferritin n=1 Tax=Brassica carinata TaxID=52824 RepID=A0A8X7TKB6_BRACI|nr:hypothetical protein Bca52824_092978 [Brassica carinata]